VYRSRRERVVAVDHVSFEVKEGEVVGLLGPNGAGKTTTIKSLCSLLRPNSGSIEVGGEDVLRHPSRALKRIAAVLEGNRNIYWRLSPRENMEFFAGLQGLPTRRVRPHIEELLERFRLEEKADTSARKLSRGMQQKLAVACALIKGTDILLLDEPTLGLDVETSYELRASLKDLARNGGRTILLSTHDMNVVQDICDRVIVIHKGKVVTDDNVSNLLDVFRARAYRFVLEGRLDDASCRRLGERFDMLQLHHTEHRSEIEVEFLDNTALYELMDVLRESGAVIEGIDRKDPNLEEIFLSIVRGNH
jgi:ABC-2 type transport system ATP-binding protein